MMEKVFYGNTLYEWMISLIIVAGAALVCKGISLLNKYVIRKITAKTNNNYDDILFNTLESPFLFGVMLIAIWIAAARLNFNADVKSVISKAYSILTVLNVTWFISKFVSAIFDEHVRKNTEKSKAENKPVDNRFVPIFKRGLIIIIWLIGFVMALNNAGVSVTALLGTLGIGGIAFALAAQDTVKNIIGGVTLFTDRPFSIGDRIKFDAIDGNVEDIGLRSTKIRTLDKRIITIPNYKIVDASIENISGEPRRRVVMKLGVTYDTTPEKMKEAIEILRAIPKNIKEIDSRDLSVSFSDFADSSLIITFVYFIKKSSPDIMESISKVNFEILSKYNSSEINFAFPSQTVYLENGTVKLISQESEEKQ